jgi:hypothetical protein
MRGLPLVISFFLGFVLGAGSIIAVFMWLLRGAKIDESKWSTDI